MDHLREEWGIQKCLMGGIVKRVDWRMDGSSEGGMGHTEVSDGRNSEESSEVGGACGKNKGKRYDFI